MKFPNLDREATIEEIYNFVDFPSSYESVLEESQSPLGPDLMLQFAAEVGLTEDTLVVDVGCYDASVTLPLVDRFACRLIGVDLGPSGLAGGVEAAGDAIVGGRVLFVQGKMEALPVATATCDLVWCRDAISCADCAPTIAELARVAKPGGAVLLHTSCVTELLEPRERDRLFTDLGLDAASMDAETIERQAADAGLVLLRRIKVGSQWLQHRLESNPSPFDLLSLARLTEWPDRYARLWGETWYRRILAWHQWPIYQALGKLEGRIWLFRAH